MAVPKRKTSPSRSGKRRSHIKFSSKNIIEDNKLKQGKKERYAYTDEERDLIIQRLETENSTTKIDVQRYKGLGEMNADQLWNTTMNAETRTLIQVTVDHIMEEETNVRFRELMGSEVEHRRKFITERAKFATNIDV